MVRLVSGELEPGMKIKPADFRSDYDCSPNTLRDVLMRLCGVGLVDFQLQRGFRATPRSADRLRDVTQFRILLECEGVAGSMEHGGVAWEAQLTATHHKLLHIERQIAADPESKPLAHLWTMAEREFHETLITACGSPLLIETFHRIYLQFRQQITGQVRDFGDSYFEAIISEHQAIVDAALARDRDACREAIHRHMSRNL